MKRHKVSIKTNSDVSSYVGTTACGAGGGFLVKAAATAFVGTGGSPLGWGIAGGCLIA